MCHDLSSGTEGIDAVIRPTWHRFRQIGSALLLGTPLLGVPILSLGAALVLVRRILRPPSRDGGDRGPTATDLLAFLGAVPATVVLLLMAFEQGNFGGPIWLVSGSFSWPAFAIFVGLFPLGLLGASLAACSERGRSLLQPGTGLSGLCRATAAVLGTVGLLISIVAVTKTLPGSDAGWYEVRQGGILQRAGRTMLFGPDPRPSSDRAYARPGRGLWIWRGNGWAESGATASNRFEIARLRYRDVWLACPDEWSRFEHCYFVGPDGGTTWARRFVIEGVDGIPTTWLVPPAVGLALALVLLLGSWQARLRWHGFLDADHAGDGFVRLAPGEEPVLIPTAAGVPAGPVVVRTFARATSGTAPYRSTEIIDADVAPGRLGDHLASAHAQASRRLAAALFLLVFLGAPLATAVVYLR